MRPAVILIPSLLSLACAGGAWMIARNRPAPEPDLGLDFAGPARHLVTDQMIRDTEAMATKPAPKFSVADYNGNTISLAKKGADKPQFIYFIMNDCPCSVDAEPLFHALYKQFKGKVNFVAITDGTSAEAERWSTEKQVPYPLIPDPSKSLIHAYGAKAATFSLLVMRNGNILKMWPGFSVGILQEMNKDLAKSIGESPRSFDALYAPVEKRTGCAF